MKASEHYWVGHPGCESKGMHEAELIRRRDEVEVIGEVQDVEANYSYDDYAICKLDGQYYLLETAGCSCPSPTETWGVNAGPCTLDQLEKYLHDFRNQWGVVKNQFDEFIAIIEKERAACASS
jgi:hypothetical protein